MLNNVLNQVCSIRRSRSTSRSQRLGRSHDIKTPSAPV